MMDRPIIFSGPMIRALLDGRKTMTRRVLKPQRNIMNGNHPLYDGIGSYSVDGGWKLLPYAPGDRLWCRERKTLALENNGLREGGENCGPLKSKGDFERLPHRRAAPVLCRHAPPSPPSPLADHGGAGR